HVELLDDLVDAQILEILDDRGHGQASTLDHPGAADLARDALNSRTPGPIERCHEPTSFQTPAYGMSARPSRSFMPRFGDRSIAATSPRSGSHWRTFGSPAPSFQPQAAPFLRAALNA